MSRPRQNPFGDGGNDYYNGGENENLLLSANVTVINSNNNTAAANNNELEPVMILPPANNDSDAYHYEDDYDMYGPPAPSFPANTSSLKDPARYEDIAAAPPNDYLDTPYDNNEPQPDINEGIVLKEDNYPREEQEEEEEEMQNQTKKPAKRKLTEEERAARLAAYENNKKKYRIGKWEVLGMVILILAVTGVLLGLNWDKIVPEKTPAPSPAPTFAPTSAPSLAPSTMAPTTVPTLSLRPTYRGYRDGTILSDLNGVTPTLPVDGDPLLNSENLNPQEMAAKFVIYQDPAYIDPMESQRVIQRYTLATLFLSTGGQIIEGEEIQNESTWYNSSGWLTELHECQWYGVTCGAMSLTQPEEEDHDEHEIITEIELTENKLIGTLPMELSALENLTDVSFFHNNLTSHEKNNSVSSPLDIFVSLPLLQILDLRSNQFHGTLPPEIGSMPRLQILYLEDNEFSGTIPEELGQSETLTTLIMHRNNLTGDMPDGLCAILNDLTADCYNNFPVNCTCCWDPFNQCY